MTDPACPKCGDALRRPKKTDVALHRCAGCAGAWLGAVSLESAVGDLSRLDEAVAELGEPTALRCPSCRHATLAKLVFRGCEIDVCKACRGVFFDAGELSAVRRAKPPTSSHLEEAKEVAGLAVGDLIVGGIIGLIDAAGDAIS